MMALRILGAKGTRSAGSVLVPLLACPATLSKRASICRCKATTASIGAAGAITYHAVASWQFCCHATGSCSFRTRGVWV
ncbi:hypothetical protein LIER_28946 [Lithospermum erythrorhizon]|uniref:Secreted protein n=1 Tax=Lithospermum erythrorhizon TaxID=34254 RepID=A0AAV3RL13_LITER